jgi:hypothetical protein
MQQRSGIRSSREEYQGKRRDKKGIHTRGAQKVMQHIYFLSPILLDKNNILCAAAFKCPAFMHVVASCQSVVK